MYGAEKKTRFHSIAVCTLIWLKLSQVVEAEGMKIFKKTRHMNFEGLVCYTISDSKKAIVLDILMNRFSPRRLEETWMINS